MSSLKNLRDKLGISQQQVAQWLGIARSLAGHYENGIRSLPTPALLQLSRLEILIAEFENSGLVNASQNVSRDTNHRGGQHDNNEYVSWGTNHGGINHDSDNVSWDTNHGGTNDNNINHEKTINHSQALHPRLTVALDKAERLNHQLSLLQSRHASLQQQMLLIQYLMDNCNGETKQKLWLQMIYHGHCCKMAKCDEARQLPVRARLIEMNIRQILAEKKEISFLGH